MAYVRIAQLWDGSPVAASECVELHLRLREDGALKIHIDAPFHRDPPPEGAAGSYAGLWNHEVVEVFLVGEDGRYTEAEFGPHGHYLVLELTAPREVQREGETIALAVERKRDRWQGRAMLPAHLLPERIVRVGAFAIHGTDHGSGQGAGTARRYLSAHTLPGPRPDFHQPDTFPLLTSDDLRRAPPGTARSDATDSR